jgi:shikimate dehydrogenase
VTTHDDRFRLAGVMGWPVAHSRSPMIHNHWLARHGLAGVYAPLAIRPEGLHAALHALPALGFAGCNLTIPHKEAALGSLDIVDPLARRIGAVNCVIARPDGALEGRNTDGWGFIQSIRDADRGWRADAGPIVVLGAGGASRAILVALAEHGARDIRLVNRTLTRAQNLAAEFGAPISAIPWEARAEALAGAAMLVNTTSQGMAGEPPLDVDLAALPGGALVADIIYIPRETPLLAAARGRGHRTLNGLGMLLHQARPSFEAWFGILPDVTPELRALVDATL